MTLSPALARLMTATVTLSTMQGMDSFGAATYGTAKRYKCRLENAQKYIKGADGRDVLVTKVIYIGTTTTGGAPPTSMGPTGKIVLPDGTSPGILMIDQNPDSDGTPHHMVLYCG